MSNFFADKYVEEGPAAGLPKKSDKFEYVERDASRRAKELSKRKLKRRMLSTLVKLRLLAPLKFVRPYRSEHAKDADLEYSSYSKTKSKTFGLAKIPLTKTMFPKPSPLRLDKITAIKCDEVTQVSGYYSGAITRIWANGSYYGVRGAIAYGRRGYYVTYRNYSREYYDIALIPTILSAIKRGHGEMKIDIEDIKTKIRAGKRRLMLIVLLDASDSMRPFIPMIVRLLLKFHKIAWKMRSLLGLVTCYGTEARVLTYPTSNINKVIRGLMNVEFSGKTPLSKGLLVAHRLIISQKIKNPDAIPRILLISDGLANIPLDKPINLELRKKIYSEAQADVFAVAKLLAQNRVRIIAINPWHITEWYSRIFISPTKLLMKATEITGGIYLGIDMNTFFKVDRYGIHYRRLKKEEINNLIDYIIASIFESLL